MDRKPTSSEIAEDHAARSGHVRVLLTALQRSKAAGGEGRIPRVVVQFWHDTTALPQDVQECLDTWSTLLKQGFQRLLFDDETAWQLILNTLGPRHARAFESCLHPAMRCDYFRLCYLWSRGGFYVDADEVYQGGSLEHLFDDPLLKAQPLCYDTAWQQMVPPEKFLNIHTHSATWIYYINNNPIIAPPAHPIIKLALKRATANILSRPESRDIQAMTGPGNFTASVVRYSVQCDADGRSRAFRLIQNWRGISKSRWPLSYRGDERNWRNWSGR